MSKRSTTALQDLNYAMLEIENEYDNATSKFPPMRSPHEGLAIVLEEYEELKAEVFKPHDIRDEWTMRQEAMQLAAMALRFMVDLT